MRGEIFKISDWMATFVMWRYEQMRLMVDYFGHIELFYVQYQTTSMRYFSAAGGIQTKMS